MVVIEFHYSSIRQLKLTGNALTAKFNQLSAIHTKNEVNMLFRIWLRQWNLLFAYAFCRLNIGFHMYVFVHFFWFTYFGAQALHRCALMATMASLNIYVIHMYMYMLSL